MKYRKKPVVIEAEELTQEYINSILEPDKFDPESYGELISFIKELGNKMYAMVYKDHADIFIRTLEGDHKANPGDMIITGVKGERYPCKPDIFALTYELVK